MKDATKFILSSLLAALIVASSSFAVTKTFIDTDSPQTLAGPKTLTAPVLNGATAGADPTLALGIATKQYVDAVVSIPVGLMFPYGGSSPPAGYLSCDGSAVLRSTYAALFAVIGTTYGSGDGSTTFNLPDKRGRLSLGAGNGAGLSNRIRGAKAGTQAPVGLHTHGVTDPGHFHSSGAVDSGQFTAGGGGFSFGAPIASTGSASTGISIQNSGTVDAMPPYEVDLWIIKY